MFFPFTYYYLTLCLFTSTIAFLTDVMVFRRGIRLCAGKDPISIWSRDIIRTLEGSLERFLVYIYKSA